MSNSLNNMRILKVVLFSLVGLIMLLLIIALFVKKEYVVSREIKIDQRVDEVYKYVKQLKNLDNYNKWVMVDPGMKRTFTGTDGTIGFRYDWDGNDEAGQGEQEITALKENKLVEISIHFIRPFEGEAKNTITTEEIESNQTKVVSEFRSKVVYPLNAMLLFVNIDDMMGKDLEVTMENLKRHLEN